MRKQALVDITLSQTKRPRIHDQTPLASRHVPPPVPLATSLRSSPAPSPTHDGLTVHTRSCVEHSTPYSLTTFHLWPCHVVRRSLNEKSIRTAYQPYEPMLPAISPTKGRLESAPEKGDMISPEYLAI